VTARAAAGPLRRSLKGARAGGRAPTYTITRDTTVTRSETKNLDATRTCDGIAPVEALVVGNDQAAELAGVGGQ